MIRPQVVYSNWQRLNADQSGGGKAGRLLIFLFAYWQFLVRAAKRVLSGAKGTMLPVFRNSLNAVGHYCTWFGTGFDYQSVLLNRLRD